MTPEESESKLVGERCCIDEFKGIVRFVGNLPHKEGTWYGVEWDDERGKHNGTLNGISYFPCRDNHGSFVRPQKVSFGTDATKEIEKVYGEGVYEGEEIVINEKTSSEKTIEMVGFAKVALQQSDLKSLKEVDLSGTKVCRASHDVSVEQICPNLKFLSLRNTMISSFKEVVRIGGKLKSLKTLNVSENVFHAWDVNAEDLRETFTQLQTIYVNRVNLTWDKFLHTLDMVPLVTEIHACFIKSINCIWSNTRIKQLKILNLEGCTIDSWKSVLQLLHNSKIEWLILNDNKLKIIEDCANEDNESNGFGALSSLSLNENLIEDWTSVNELNYFKCLKELRFRKNPVCEGMTSFALRQELISRLPVVDIMNGSKVEKNERRIAEVAYLKKYSKDYHAAFKNEHIMKKFQNLHPRYTKLVEEHGAPPNENLVTTEILKEKLLSITLQCPDCETKKSIMKRVPATMTIQQLKGILQRVFKVPNTKQRLSYLDEKNSREIELDDNLKQLTYYSVANGDTVLLRW